MTAAISAQAIAETLEDTKPMLWELVHLTHRKCPWKELEDLFSQSTLLFMQAFVSFDRSKDTSFSSWLYTKVYYGLLDYVKRDVYRAKPYRGGRTSGNIKSCDMQEAERTNAAFSSPAPSFFLVELLEQLSEEARVVVTIALEPPPGLQEAMLADNPNPSGPSTRRGIRQYLLGLGWTGKQVSECFREIKMALSQ